MELLLYFGQLVLDGVSTVQNWLFTEVSLGSLGDWTVIKLVFGGGLVVLLGWKVACFIADLFN